MLLTIYSRSDAFKAFMQSNPGLDHYGPIHFETRLVEPDDESSALCLLHISSYGEEALGWLVRLAKNARCRVAVCADRPDIAEMLECTRLGARAYCNSHMQSALYQQMLRLLENGQSWFPPDLLQKTFDIAQSALAGKDTETLLADLTAREKQIAIAVSEGKSNRQIAQEMAISEPTVKTHLTHIFKKLDLKDRLSLALLLT